MKRAYFVCLFLCLITTFVALSAPAQTETTLYTFCSEGGESCKDGGRPTSRLTFDTKGNLYGTTYYGGLGYGTVFELSPNGHSGWNETVLYTFTGGADGANPYLSYVLFDKMGNLYGTTSNGGLYGYGVVFELSPVGASWTETVLYSFAGGADGAAPENGLVMDSKGNLYGVTASGGSGTYGFVFELSPSGDDWKEEVIYNVTSTGAGLIMDATGNIFGVSIWTVIELSPNGSGGWNPTVIYTFKAQYGQSPNPQGTLVFDSAGNLYGTTAGILNNALGKVYKLSPSENGQWAYQNIYTLEVADCSRYQAGVVLDAAENVYGTTACGGPDLMGTVFGLSGPDSTGKYQERFNWTFDGTDGANPLGSLILDSAGNLYGTATVGGTLNSGVVFEVTPPPTVTTTTLSSSPNPSTYGESAIFTALVTSSLGAPPNGETVSLMKGKTVLATGTLSGGSATFNTSTLPAGNNSITAVYAGDSKLGSSTSKALKQVVDKATTTTALVSSLNPTNSGQSVTFTATVTPEFTGAATGTVSFYDGTTLLKGVALNKEVAKLTTKTLTSGKHTITATYNGSTDFTGSGDSVTQTVN